MATIDSAVDERAAHSEGKLIYILAILAAVSFLNYYDRNLIGILLQPIKESLHLSDSDLGLLVGPAFALIYTVMGVPIARFADRGHRVATLSAALTIWSTMTSLCGFATSLTAMMLARLGVGIGEAGGLPTTHALVAEHFPPERRASALSIIAIVAMLGVMSGTLFGGLLNDWLGWRKAFMIAGGPGLLLAAIVFISIREPGKIAAAGGKVPTLGMLQALKKLARRRSFLFISAGMACAALSEYAAQAWIPTYLIRHFGLTPGELGLRYSLLTGIPAVIGMLTGGLVVDRWVKRDPRASVWILILTFSFAIPMSLAFYLSDNLTVALGIQCIYSLFAGLYIGPNYALIQGLAGEKMRATAAAIYMLIVNFVGLGAGPLLAGMLSDFLSKQFAIEGLRWALCLMLSSSLVGLFLFLKAVRTVATDLADAARD